MANLHILLCLSPFQNSLVDQAIRIAETAADKDHTVSIFLYMDGVYNMMLTQDGSPFRLTPIYKRLEKLLEKGVKINTCKLCKLLRGISDDNMPDEIVSSGTGYLDDAFQDADIVLSFTR